MTTWSHSRHGRAPTGAAASLWRWLGILGRPTQAPAPTVRELREPIGVTPDQASMPSFAAALRWRWVDPQAGQFVGHDIRQRAVMLELQPADVEARDADFIASLASRLALALRALPEADPPWVCQAFIQDEPVLALEHQLREYARRHAGVTPVTEGWIALIGKHFQRVCAPGGYFVDPLNDLPWRGRYRRVRLVLYRRTALRASSRGQSHSDELRSVTRRVTEALREAGVRARLLDGEALLSWMLPRLTGDSGYDYLDSHPYPTASEREGSLPASFDLAELALRAQPIHSEAASGSWRIGDTWHRYLSLAGLRDVPRHGVWTLAADGQASTFDRLPEGTMLELSFVAWPQDQIEKQIQTVADASVTGSTDARLTSEQCGAALEWMAQGHRLFGLHTGVLLRADSEEGLQDGVTQTQAAVAAAGLDVIPPEYDLFALDGFVRAQPWGFDPIQDRATSKRTRLCWDSHGAALLPLYGRGTGTGNPGQLWFNRLGEPFTVDPLNPEDRRKNGHLFMFGPTGSGKTATLIAMMMQALAFHRPRLFVITALPTFGLFADWCRSVGLTVNHIRINPNDPIPLPPFADAESLLNGRTQGDEGGDPLGQTEIAARLMITGGEAKEEAELYRSDKTRIGEAILDAARHCIDEGKGHVLPEDVAAALSRMSDDDSLTPSQQETLSNQAAAMRKFCSGFPGALFNQPGEPWPDVDVTVVELGALTRRGYEDLLAVSMVGLMNRINDRVEAHQHSGRQTVTLVDEAHKFLQNPLLSPYLLDMGAMWRTFGGWLWIATQNLHQFPPEAKALLNQPEWWICLSMDPDQVEKIAEFKVLTPEQRALLLTAKKKPGLYTEGVVMADVVTGLFRAVPPSLALALAMSEQHEKAERAEIRRTKNCSDFAAAQEIAHQLDIKRGSRNDP